MILAFLLRLVKGSLSKKVLKGPMFWSHLPFLHTSLLFTVSVLDKLYYAPFPTHVLGLPFSEVVHMCPGLKSDPSIRASLIASTSISTEPSGFPERNVSGFSAFPQHFVDPSSYHPPSWIVSIYNA